ncbi:MAG: uroporphyrinogen decarboxylase [Aquisalinus sp.]|nr:uroporphyrinogen decarboxylase [Aquisalinus sp.]
MQHYRKEFKMRHHPAFIRAIKGEKVSPKPIWFMRQAGRYLPEYREKRAEAGSFLDLCFNPEMAAEVTLQPIRRFDLDAAILFADILLLPMFMGQELSFEAGEGPRLRPPLQDGPVELSHQKLHDGLSPIMETIRLCREALPEDKALIGFAGAPWTVATYMIAGQGVKDPSSLRSYAYENPETFQALIHELENATISYFKRQISAGVNAVQLFESWASGLPVEFLRAFCLEPAKRIAKALKAEFPEVPVIAFPKGAGVQLREYAEAGTFDAVSLGTETDPIWAVETLSSHVALQGGLDPLLVVRGGTPMFKAAEQLLTTFADKAYVFNLGHGFVPQTPPENVAELVKFIRTF